MNRQGGPWAHRRAGAELALRIDVHPSLLSKVEHGRIEAWPRCRQAAATAHPEASSYVRPKVPHELCVPGSACDPIDGLVMVILFEPGIRGRIAVDLPPAVRA